MHIVDLMCICGLSPPVIRLCARGPLKRRKALRADHDEGAPMNDQRGDSRIRALPVRRASRRVLRTLALGFGALQVAGCGASSLSKNTGGASPQDAGSAVVPEDGAFAEGAVAAGCIDDVSAGQHTDSCDGLTYDVDIPPACASSACGPVVDVHGLSMSGRQEGDNTNLRKLGEEAGYIVVQPNAVPAPPLSSWTPSTDE